MRISLMTHEHGRRLVKSGFSVDGCFQRRKILGSLRALSDNGDPWPPACYLSALIIIGRVVQRINGFHDMYTCVCVGFVCIFVYTCVCVRVCECVHGCQELIMNRDGRIYAAVCVLMWHTYVHAVMCMYTCTHMYVYMHVHTYTHIHTHAYMQVFADFNCVLIDAPCVYVCMYVCIYVYMCVCMYIYIYIYI